ncbi:MAG: FAD-binding oxidoreductase [Sandaracinus sp.]
MRYRRDELRWNGWGTKDARFETHGRDAALWKFVAEALGLRSLPETPSVPLSKVQLPAIRLSEAARGALAAATASDRVKTDAFERALHALGRSYYDMIRLRAGDLTKWAPDAVVYPESEAEVLAVLRAAEEHGFAIVPFGGGSSVVGGVEASSPDGRAVVTLDTTRMARLLEVDGTSHTGRAQAGIYGPALEDELGRTGFTLGHFPQSFEYSTLGGWIAARGAGQMSNRYGTADKWLVAARVATPRGVLVTKPFPASAAGPSLNQVVCGSEGALGILTEATFKLHRVAEKRVIVAFLYKEFEDGVRAVRRLVQEEVGAAMMRLSDRDETHFFGAFRHVIEPSRVQALAEKGLGVIGYEDKCVLMLALEGDEHDVAHRLARARAIATKEGGLFVGGSPGKSWWKRRFEMPLLRDPMLDHGLGIDTLETSTEWANVPRLARAVREALVGALAKENRRAIVMTHVSHSYLDGCSLYFTYLFERDDARAIEQWRSAKEAASKAISETAGTISHHHGVGADHAHWLPAEKGAVGMQLLGAMKREMDPKGVLNPGKLLPAQ